MRRSCLHMRATRTWDRLRAGRPIEALRRAGRSFGQSLRRPHTFAVCLAATDEPVGSIGLMPSRCESNRRDDGLELEVGYWIAKPFWGRGFAPEAVRAMQRYAFETLGCKALWCGYYEGNDKSLRVQQKCGFAPHHVERDMPCELMGDVRTEYFTYLTREDWRGRAEGER